jgi:tetratricopeptide (TPR) repeat protein
LCNKSTRTEQALWGARVTSTDGNRPVAQLLPGQDDGAAPSQIIETAMAMRDRGHAAEAVPLVRQALNRSPDHLRLWHVLGLLHRALEESAAAIDAFEHAVGLAPRDPKVTHALARVTMEAGLPATALYEAARSVAPADGDLLIGRAAAQAAHGEIEQAIVDLDAILAANPAWVQGQNSLAEFRWMAGQRDRFTAGFERALAARPGDQALWLALLNQHVRVDQFAEVRDIVGKARSHLAGNQALDVFEAIAASELGDKERADHLFAALAPYPDIAFSVRAMRHMLRTDRPEEAARIGEGLIGKPAENEMWPYLGLAWRILDDPRWHWLERDERLIRTYDIADRIDFGALAVLLRKLHVLKADMAGQSVRGGTQTDGPLFARAEAEIRNLRKCLVDVIESHMRALPPIDATHPVLRHAPGIVRFAGSWSVRLATAGRHTNHIHPQGWLSSALYVALPDPAELGAEPAGWLAFGRPPEELGLDLEPYESVRPKIGSLTLFPSIMWHGTVPFDGGERLTVAFDVAPPS